MCPSSPAKEEDYVEKFQKVLRLDRSARQSLWWSAVNAALFTIVLYDLTESCSRRPSWAEYTELAFVIVLFINILYHIGNYFYILLTFNPVPMTLNQKKLLGVDENDLKFPTLTEEMIAKNLAEKAAAKKSPPTTPLNMSSSSWLSLSMLSKKSNMSPNVSGLLSTPNLSVIQQANMSLNQSWNSPNQSWSNSLNSSLSNSWMYRTSGGTPSTTPVNLETDEPVVDEASLLRYLDKLEKLEQKLATNTSQNPLNSSPTNLSLLWNSQVSSTSPDLVLPTNMAYHLSTNVQAPTLNKTGSPGIESLPGVTSIPVNEKLWQKEGIGQERLSQWNKNLRQWITMTVLNPVIKEIDDTNQALHRLGLNEEKIGLTSLDKLKRVSQTQQVSQYIPNFATLLTFLEAGQNQEYLIQRIKELAFGGCMSDFRWNSGSSFNGKPWDETLPSDTQIVMHFLAMYLDVQLPPMRHRSDPRPFSAVYLSKPTDKPKPGENVVLVHQVTASPPHFVLIWKNSVYEVPKGRNNMLHTLLIFLHKLKIEEAGMLGRINMGPSGLNIMWVLNEA